MRSARCDRKTNYGTRRRACLHSRSGERTRPRVHRSAPRRTELLSSLKISCADVSTKLRRAFLQPTRMSPPMEDRQYPNLLISDNVINPVEFEPVYWPATYVGKSNSMMQRGPAECPDGAIYFIQELLAQTRSPLLIPDCRVKRVLLSEWKFSDRETHEVARARVRSCRPKVPAVPDAPEPARGGERVRPCAPRSVRPGHRRAIPADSPRTKPPVAVARQVSDQELRFPIVPSSQSCSLSNPSAPANGKLPEQSGQRFVVEVPGIAWLHGGRPNVCRSRPIYPTAAITLSSIAIGVGSAVISTVVRVGFGLLGPAKCSA